MSIAVRRAVVPTVAAAALTVLLLPTGAHAAGPVYRPHSVSTSGVQFAPAKQVRGNPFSANGKLLAGSSTANGVTQAAVYDVTTKKVTLLGGVTGAGSIAVDVNDRGDVVGTRAVDGHPMAFFLPVGGTYVRQVGTNLQPYAMNNLDQIVGETTDTFRAFRWDRATRALDLLPAGESGNPPVRANGINSQGLIVAETDQDGAVYDPATKITTELPRPTLAGDAWDINDRGVVVGTQIEPDQNRVFTYVVSTGKRTVLPSNGHEAYPRTISKAGVVAGILSNTRQPAVWNDCGVSFKAFATAGDPKLVGTTVFGTDAQGATWTTFGAKVVRWTRNPAC